MKDACVFTIEVDEGRGVITVIVHGFWTVADANRFRAAILHHAAEMRRKTGRLKLMIDASEGWVQSPEAIAILVPLEKDLVRGPNDKVAVATGTALLKMQAERTRSDDRSKVFRSLEEANAWLEE